MLCSGKKSAKNIFEIAMRNPPNENDDEKFEDSAVFGINTYLSLVVMLLKDLGRLLGGEDGGGGGGGVKKLKQELTDMITLKEAAEEEKVKATMIMLTLQEELTRMSEGSDKVVEELAEMTVLRKGEEEEKENTIFLMDALNEELTILSTSEKNIQQQLIVCTQSMETMSIQEVSVSYFLIFSILYY